MSDLLQKAGNAILGQKHELEGSGNGGSHESNLGNEQNPWSGTDNGESDEGSYYLFLKKEYHTHTPGR